MKIMKVLSILSIVAMLVAMGTPVYAAKIGGVDIAPSTGTTTTNTISNFKNSWEKYVKKCWIKNKKKL